MKLCARGRRFGWTEAPLLNSLLFLIWLWLCPPTSGQDVLFETTSPYHHIQVIERAGMRTLSFDGTSETRMSLADPLQGHFQYTEFFHLPWLWHTQMTSVLMVGLGGASTQRSYAYYYPEVSVETVELDSRVLFVATEYFGFEKSPKQQVHISDGRVFLRRTQAQYDAILMDAYTENRYGSSLPQHLATKEFFELTAAHLTPDGVLAYNVIGTLGGWRSELVGAMSRTLRAVFGQVYYFPASDSMNIVFIATKNRARADLRQLQARATGFLAKRPRVLPTFRTRLSAFRADSPPGAARAPLLTDDFAPVEGLLRP